VETRAYRVGAFRARHHSIEGFEPRLDVRGSSCPAGIKPAPLPLRENSVNRIKHWTVRIAPLVALVVASGAAGKWR